MSLHCGTFICSIMLCEWLLYCSYVVTVVQLYVAQSYVSFFTGFVCRHCNTVICIPMLYEWLLDFSCVVTVIQLYVVQCYVSGY